MGYKIFFFGLINFFDLEPSNKLVLLPDGTNPGDGIPPHEAAFIVRKKDIAKSSDWWAGTDGEKLKNYHLMKFPIQKPSNILISGMYEPPGPSGCLPFVSTDKLKTQQTDLLPKLIKINPKFCIKPHLAATIAQLPLRRGTLGSFRFKLSVKHHSAVSTLKIKHHRERITITAMTEGGEVKTLELKHGSEFVLINISAPNTESTVKEGTHFRLYAQLDEKRDDYNLHKDPVLSADLPPFLSKHPYVQYLLAGHGHIPGAGCSNTGCC